MGQKKCAEFLLLYETSLKMAKKFQAKFQCVYKGQVLLARERGRGVSTMTFQCTCDHNQYVHLRMQSTHTPGVFECFCPEPEFAGILQHYQVASNLSGPAQLEALHQYLVKFLTQIIMLKRPLPTPH